jgi:hypothetical protein
MPKFRKKPVIIEAIQLRHDNRTEILLFAKMKIDVQLSTDTYPDMSIAKMVAFIKTDEGTMRADEGDWIIKDVKGEFYPCKPDIFEQTYEPA